MSIQADPSDSALMRRTAAGDRDAFLALYDRHASRVLGLAVRMLGERGAAEEVAQDAFLKLWERAASFDPARGSLPAWLLTITRRTALDRIRREGRRPAIDSELDLELTDPSSAGEEARWQSLRFGLADLPGEQRQVIELAYYHGLSHSQLAAHLGLPLGTVKTRLRLGMERLRAAWSEQKPEAGKRSKPGPRGVSQRKRSHPDG